MTPLTITKSLGSSKGYSIKKMLKDSWSSQKLFFKILFEAHRPLELRISSLYLEGAFVDTKNVTSPPNIKKLYGAASYQNGQAPPQASDLVKIKQKLQGHSKQPKERYT